MNPRLSSTQEEYVSEKIASQLDRLVVGVIALIEKVVAETNEDLRSDVIVFGKGPTVNTDYFTAVVHEHLFEKLHKGDIQIAKIIIEMAAKRTGLDVVFKS
ncbi:hypothetical protein QMA77_23385 [Pantoea ananatis]|nr:hypothetical protein [Pantoea ananatis]